MRHGNPAEAACTAGYKTKYARTCGVRLLQRYNIHAAVLKAQALHSVRGEATAQSVMEHLADIRDSALREGQLTIALRAEELRGKHIGMFHDKSRTRKVPKLEEMTEDEILEILGINREEAEELLKPDLENGPERHFKNENDEQNDG